nr:hypothetical protein [Paludisphaera soli]
MAAWIFVSGPALSNRPRFQTPMTLALACSRRRISRRVRPTSGVPAATA